MNYDILVIVVLNFIIALIGTLAYSVRIVGVRTGQIAISFALFNVLALVSRTSNVIQLPKLTKYVEQSNSTTNLYYVFIIIIAAVFIATVLGAFLIPTFQRLFSKAVESFSVEKSIYK